MVRLVAEVAARGLDSARGYTSTACYLRDVLGVSLTEARSRDVHGMHVLRGRFDDPDMSP